MKFSNLFLDTVKSSECVLFVGSGISMWSKLPHWSGLLNQMVEFLTDRGLTTDHELEIREVINRGDLLTAASLCAMRMREADLREFIDKVFRNPDPLPHEIHDLIVSLGPTCFITTNYDELLEDSFYNSFKIKLAFVNNDQPVEQGKLQKSGASSFIFKIHGSISSTKTIIISRENYRKLIYESKSTINTLKFLFTSRPIIYMGFGLRDPDFLMLKDEIASTFHGAERDHFAIMADVGELEVEYWKKEYGINIISYKTEAKEVIIGNSTLKTTSHDNLLVLLQNLYEQVQNIQTKQDPQILLKSSIIKYCEAISQTLDTEKETRITLTTKYRYDLFKGKENVISIKKTNISLSDVFSLPTNLIIIGAPGSGKSFSAQKFSAIIAKELLAKLKNIVDFKGSELKQLLPVVLPMKEYKGDIKKMIASRLPQNIDVDLALELGWLTLIFDAVNEAPRNLFENGSGILFNNIQWLTNLYPKNRFILTSRSMNYVSFLEYPVYEIQPITYSQVEMILSEELNQSYDNLSSKMHQILLNPLFLKMYLQTNEENKNIIDVKSLVDAYLKLIQQKINAELNSSIISLNSIFSAIAYKLVDKGIQEIDSREFLKELEEQIPLAVNVDELLSSFIKFGILVVDMEGNISFFHQTITEYLAAYELVKVFNENPFVVEEKIKSLNWDETIILFIGFLEKNTAKAVLKKIAEKDILFATRAFAGATLKDEDIGTQLFHIAFEKLQNPSISESEAVHLAFALADIGEYGSVDKLLNLQSNIYTDVSVAASMVLAIKGEKKAIDKIMDGLMKERSWRFNGYDKSLKLLANSDIVETLFSKVKNVDSSGEMIISNIAEVISAFESEDLYLKIDVLLKSEVKEEILFGAKILGKINSEAARNKLMGLLKSPFKEVRLQVLYGFRDKSYKPIKSERLIDLLFESLSDDEIGSKAANYLSQLNDNEIAQKAINRIDGNSNNIELINLSSIISRVDPEKAYRVLIDKLENYDPLYVNTLPDALKNLNNYYSIVDELIIKILSCEEEVRKVILSTICYFNYNDKNRDIEYEDFERLFQFWEYYCGLGRDHWTERHSLENCISKICYTTFKSYILEKFNNKNYKYRKFLIDILGKCPIKIGDLQEDTVDWLIELMDNNSNTHVEYLITEILSNVCNETKLQEKIIPLLSSNNETLKSNAYLIIKKAERVLGIRFDK